jgi:hypothetical protein
MDDLKALTDDSGRRPRSNTYADQNRAVLNEAEAADYTRVSVSSLRKGRMNGRRDNHVEPPPYLKLGRRVAYLRTDLDAWLIAHRVGV